MPKITSQPDAAPKPAKAAKSPKPAKGGKSQPDDRKVLYPEKTAELFLGKNALTTERAKKILGWITEDEWIVEEKAKHPSLDEKKARWKDGDYLLIDYMGNKVRTLHNTKNRPFTQALADKYCQEHLKKKWNYNGEGLSVGMYGEVLSGQHRLISLILAEQIRLKGNVKTAWDGPVTMDCLIAFGVDENDEVTNTIDTGKPRTLADALYRTHYFANLVPGDRKVQADMAGWAIRLLWDRTKEKDAPFSKYRTHAESCDFLARHEKIIPMVKHIWEEDAEKAISGDPYRYCPKGTAAGWLYLMAASATDPAKYYAPREVGDPTSEKAVNWKYLSRAKEFWSTLASPHPKFKAIRDCLAEMSNSTTGEKPSDKLKLITLCKAWAIYKDMPEMDSDEAEDKWLAKNLTVKAIKPLFEEVPDSDGDVFIDIQEEPGVGGIDNYDAPEKEGKKASKKAKGTDLDESELPDEVQDAMEPVEDEDLEDLKDVLDEGSDDDRVAAAKRTKEAIRDAILKNREERKKKAEKAKPEGNARSKVHHSAR